jgi:hypothetical protein
MRDENLNELTARKYFWPKVHEVETGKLRVIRGFDMTLSLIKTASFFLRIDVCSRVFRAKNLLEEIQERRSKDFDSTLVGKTVITNYGKRRTYRILAIRRDMTP